MPNSNNENRHAGNEEKPYLSLEERYAVYKQKQADDERAAQLAAEEREVQKLIKADEWLRQVLAERFPTETFQKHDHIAITATRERIGPVYHIKFRGLGLFFHSKEKGSLSLYTPALGSVGCSFVTSLGTNFTEIDFFDAIDAYFERNHQF